MSEKNCFEPKAWFKRKGKGSFIPTWDSKVPYPFSTNVYHLTRMFDPMRKEKCVS